LAETRLEDSADLATPLGEMAALRLDSKKEALEALQQP
jgi:hypothetical protein